MFTVKEIAKTDLPQMAWLEKTIFSDAWSESAIEDTYELSYTKLLGVYEPDGLKGYVIAYLAAGEGEIARIAVDRSCRRRGAAGYLFSELEQYLQRDGVDKIFLEVRESNSAAISLYEKYGFIRDGVRKHYYANPMENALLMSKCLGR